MENREVILRSDHVSMYFGGVKAVEDFSMEIEPGVTIGIIGPNGAGKTTIFNVFTKIYQQTKGSIEFNGVSIDSKNQVEVSRMGMARTFQNIRLFSGMSVLDNVKVALDYNGKYTMAEAVLHLPRRNREEKRIAEEAMKKFIVKRDAYASVIAGYPWFLDWGRDTLIALRGLIAGGFQKEGNRC